MQVWQAICTSAPIRASIRVSPDFTLLTHSSPSFGSDPSRCYSNLSQKIEVGRYSVKIRNKLLSFRIQVCHPHTRDRGRLLGPCFKTGRMKTFNHHKGIAMLSRMMDQLCAIQNSAQPSPPVKHSENYPPKNIRARISTQEREAPQRGRDHRAIIFQHLIPDGNYRREAQLPSSSSQLPLRNSSFHLRQPQSQP